MSVDFYIIDDVWTESKAPCFYCQVEEVRSSCPVCSGTGHYISSSPSRDLNVGNATFRKLSTLTGLPSRCEGELDAEGIPAVRRRILLALNSTSQRGVVTTPPSDTRAFETARVVVREDGVQAPSRGCRVIDQGYSDERIVDHLRALDGFLAEAQKRGKGIYWG